MTKDLSETLPKSPMMYGLGMSRILRDIKENICLDSPVEKCERNLMKNLSEIYSLYRTTKEEGYKKIFDDSFKEYSNILNKKFPKKNESRLKNLNEIPPEEMEEEILIWRRALEIDN